MPDAPDAPDAPAWVYAARYRAARGFAGLTQPALAKKLGVDAQTIKRRESGKQAPRKGERMAVAALCGVPVEFMEGGWGALEPDEIRDLLSQQTAILDEIKQALQDGRQLADVLTSEGDEFARRVLQLARQALRDDAQAQAQETRTPGQSGTRRR